MPLAEGTNERPQPWIARQLVVERFTRNHPDDDTTQRDHRSGSHTGAERGRLTKHVARTELTNRYLTRSISDENFAVTRFDDVCGVGAFALPHDHVTTLEALRLEPASPVEERLDRKSTRLNSS